MKKAHRTLTEGFFITATDTGIGKTFVSRILIQTFMKILPTTYFKPVQTGCFVNEKGELVSPDFEFILQGGLQLSADYGVHVPYRFKPACSLHLAGRMENRDISIDHIKSCFAELRGGNDNSRLVIVEGAGGIYAPLGNSSFMIDCIAALNLPVVLVVSQKLGTINHTILSLKALKELSLCLAGVIMNNYDDAPDDFICADNRSFIRDIVHPAPFIALDFNAAHSPSLEVFCRELIG